MSDLTIGRLIRSGHSFDKEVDKVKLKFFVIAPDEPNRIIELELVQVLNGGADDMVLQLKAKDELPIPK